MYEFWEPNIYNEDKWEHLSHLQEVFQTSRNQELYANLKKCEFFIINLVFFGFVIFSEGVKMDPMKIEVVLS